MTAATPPRQTQQDDIAEMKDFTPETILIYTGDRFDGALGESIIKLPFLFALREVWPQAHLTWFAGEADKPVFAGSLAPFVEGRINEIISDRYLPLGFKGATSFGNPLPGRSFELIIDLQKNVVLTRQIRRVPHRRFITATWKWLLSDMRPPEEQMKTSRESMRLVSLAAAAAGRVLPIPFSLPAPERFRQAAAALLPEGEIYVGLSPGAGNKVRGKLWPLERYLSIGRRQIEKGRKPVVVIGPDEAGWVPAIKEALPEALIPGFDDHPIPKDASGIPLTMALGARMAAAVANCAGTAHMLGTGGAPMVALYGPTNPRKYMPHGKNSISLESKDFGGGQNIAAIPEEAVLDAIEKQIAGFPDHQDQA